GSFVDWRDNRRYQLYHSRIWQPGHFRRGMGDSPLNKQMKITVGIIVAGALVLAFVLARRSGGGSVSTLGSAPMDSGLQQAELSAKGQAFSALAQLTGMKIDSDSQFKVANVQEESRRFLASLEAET